MIYFWLLVQLTGGIGAALLLGLVLCALVAAVALGALWLVGRVLAHAMSYRRRV